MKLTRSVITIVFTTLLAFTAMTSCKNTCYNTTCFNGGSCSNGFCTCPYGYTGTNCQTPNPSYVQYYNHTRTAITLTLNNVAYTIPPQQIKGFSGQYGDSLNGNAFTSGAYGETINWPNLSNTYPITGTTTVNFDVSASYYYLEIANDSSSSIIREINVNAGLPTEVDIILPAPYLAYQSSMFLGYFYDSLGSNVHLKSTTEAYFDFPTPPATSLSLPNTQDQAILVTAP